MTPLSLLALLLGAAPENPVQEGAREVLEVGWREVAFKRKKKPKYPAEARERGIEADCSMRVHFDERGKASQADPVDCPELFVPNTRAALLEWTIRPYRLDGEAVPVRVVVQLKFMM